MAVLSFPSITPQSCEWALESKTQTFESPLNGSIQTGALPGDKWRAMLTFTNQQGRPAHQLRAFLASLRGRSGRFYLTPHDHPAPDGTAAGSGVVSGAGQTGSALVTSGWTPDQSSLLLMGDYFQVGDEIKIITADTASDESGNATLTFAPPLRTSPANGAAIVTNNPKCIMMLEDDRQARFAASSPVIYAMSISCVEPLDI